MAILFGQGNRTRPGKALLHIHGNEKRISGFADSKGQGKEDSPAGLIQAAVYWASLELDAEEEGEEGEAGLESALLAP